VDSSFHLHRHTHTHTHTHHTVIAVSVSSVSHTTQPIIIEALLKAIGIAINLRESDTCCCTVVDNKFIHRQQHSETRIEVFRSFRFPKFVDCSFFLETPHGRSDHRRKDQRENILNVHETEKTQKQIIQYKYTSTKRTSNVQNILFSSFQTKPT